ncbi:MAG: hypothetical protein JXA77_07455 [Bacteroidales bacterium]|nr:hypothetical protein [Bacteroidales bacterium]MBN2819713.1 hypothetical protein [Bacteroidales bacterium]
MKNIKVIILFLLGMIVSFSCKEIDNEVSKIADGDNLAAFENTSMTVTQVADGSEYTIEVKLKLVGPSTGDITDDIVVTLGAGASSTAVEGTHYRFDETSVTLAANNNHLAIFSFTMLTEGIETPLASSPVLALTVTAASGNDNVIASGKPVNITLNFACPSELAGTYDVETIYTAVDGTVSTLGWTETITKIGVGTYRTERVGHWSIAALGGTPGFTFTDICGDLSIGGQNLVDLYSNWVEGTDVGTVDPDTGVLYMEYSICASGSCRYYQSTYTPQ